MPRKLKDISNRALVHFFHPDEDHEVTLGECFGNLIVQFNKNHEDSFGLIHAICTAGILVEATIKERLVQIDPALILNKVKPDDLALLSGRVKLLRNKPNKEACDVQAENISKLLGRYDQFFDFPEAEVIKNFLKIRNRLVHSGLNFSIHKLEVAQMLAEYIFPFLKKHIDVQARLWRDFEAIAEVYQDEYRVDLLRKIKTAREKYAELTSHNIQKAIETDPKLPKDEFFMFDCLPCPGCGRANTAYVGGVDFESERDAEDGVVIHSYTYSVCRVCSLELGQVDIEEIVSNPDVYFEDPEEAEFWSDALHDLRISDL